MSTTLAQLKQWPPTSTTVIGAGILVGLGSYMLTGSWEVAAALAGFFKLICPQDAAAVDTAIAEARKIATTPAP
jgi:hypothetical protein